jgi:flagellar export protein FliJ
MKRRDSLLRLKRFRVDEMKRQLATLDEMKADLERKLADLDDTVERERQRATDSEIGRVAFPSFLQSIEVRRKNIRTTMKDLEHQRLGTQDELAAAYQDLKSFEVAEEERLRRAAEAESRASQSRLDEIAIVRHLRKHAVRQGS